MKSAQPLFQAFSNISRFELMLRRIVRWEMMRRHGRSWFANLKFSYDQVSERIIRDKKAGVYNSNSSELSYLGMSEIIDLIYKELWNEVFTEVFDRDRGMMSIIRNAVVPLRNKVAHFREVDTTDLFNLKHIFELRDRLRKHYGSSELVFYFNSDPEYVSEQIDQENIAQARGALSECGCLSLFDEYARFEAIRSAGISPGMGAFDKHFFIELQSDTINFRRRVFDWSDRRRSEVTLIVNTALKTRIFWPLVLGEAEIKRQLGSLHSALTRHSVSVEMEAEVRDYLEYYVGYDKDFSVGFAF